MAVRFVERVIPVFQLGAGTVSDRSRKGEQGDENARPEEPVLRESSHVSLAFPENDELRT
mgnify:CR=1 FL=1